MRYEKLRGEEGSIDCMTLLPGYSVEWYKAFLVEQFTITFVACKTFACLVLAYLLLTTPYHPHALVK